ncbi:vascular endothelial growth factor A, isoform CRA_h, partial [Rattus norvegicus]
MALLWIPTRFCKSTLPLWALPGRIRSLAIKLSPPLLRSLGGLPQGSWQREDTVVEEEAWYRAMGQDPQAPHGGREKRKCFIY